MKVLSYFAFTLLSILIQFSVMDFIQERARLDAETIDLNTTSPKKGLEDVLKDFKAKPHAFYYRTQYSRLEDKSNISPTTKPYSNSTLPEISLETSTELTSTLFEVLYDENVSVTEDTFTTVTESLFTTTEFDNVTEITLFEIKNNTVEKQNITPKKSLSKDCDCNLLYKVCDINCCCDSDCTDAEQKLFTNCLEKAFHTDETDVCFPPILYNGHSGIDGLFCVVKTNLPAKRLIHSNTYDKSLVNKAPKWHSHTKTKALEKFTRTAYNYDDPIWFLRNGSVFYLDLPSPLINNYCIGRRPIKFLHDEQIKCDVKLKDLEIFHILGTVQEAFVISATEKSLNTSGLNCSTLHCSNWTIMICNEISCVNYNKTIHDPLCNEITCAELALRVDYVFYYHDSKIINVTLILYTEKISLEVPFMSQEINVKYVMANQSLDNIVEFSGNPGYIEGLPLVVSFTKSNHTDDFFNKTSRRKNLQYAENKKGVCTLSNIHSNKVLFGSNKRTKCRYHHVRSVTVQNATDTCNSIQNNISQLLGLTSKLRVSPYGNPYNVKDEDWVPLELATPENPLYGEMYEQKIVCYNLVTRLSLIFTYSDESTVENKRENKILAAKSMITTRNVTFNIEELAAAVTIDIIFIDVTKPSFLEFARGPHLNIHLPKDFFLPFPSNESYGNQSKIYLILMCLVAFINK